ncbi:MAG: hypothetical protein Q7S33_05425 [Nanoarchaeota archaeon]|nr:hypothetical protein [Nanoarchaeota archaeon]
MNTPYVRCATQESALEKLREIRANVTGDYIKPGQAEIIPSLRLCNILKDTESLKPLDYWYDVHYILNPKK